jgi:hypothetical protein
MRYDDVVLSNSDPKIGEKSLAHLFGVSVVDGNYVFRSNKTVMVLGSASASSDLFDEYQFSAGDSWSSVAYKFYGSEELWWVICKFNQMSNPFLMPAVGETIRMPKMSVVNAILSSVMNSGRSET